MIIFFGYSIAKTTFKKIYSMTTLCFGKLQSQSSFPNTVMDSHSSPVSILSVILLGSIYQHIRSQCRSTGAHCKNFYFFLSVRWLTIPLQRLVSLLMPLYHLISWFTLSSDAGLQLHTYSTPVWSILTEKLHQNVIFVTYKINTAP